MIKYAIKILGGLWLSGPRYWWSKFKRFFFERKYKSSVTLPKIASLGAIRKELAKITWTQDNVWNLFDCVSYPETTYATKKDDCDGFATLAIHLLKQLGIRGYYYTYIPLKWQRAHTVCIFLNKGKIYRFDNAGFIKSGIRKFDEYKDKYFPDRIIDDLRDINFKKVKSIT